jgi:hypothetical protein
MPEVQLTARKCGVDAGAVPGQQLEANATCCEVMHHVDQVTQLATKPGQLPNETDRGPKERLPNLSGSRSGDYPIESALSVTRRVTARVTRWRDGDMRRRWCVAGLLRAERQFRRVKGHRALPTLIKALEASTRARRSGIERGA